MFYPKLIIQVIDNAPKGGIGTVFGIDYYLNSIGTDYITYSLLDQIHNTNAYKKYIEVYNLFQKEKQAFEEHQKNTLSDSKESVKQERLKDNALTEELVNSIQTKLSNFSELIEEFKKGKDKALNSIVGRILKSFKDENINIDPLVLKETILKVI